MSRNITVDHSVIRNLREDKGLSRLRLTERAEKDSGMRIAPITIERMETKPGQRFTPEVVDIVASALGCPSSVLKTSRGEDFTTVYCTEVREGRELYDIAETSDGLEFDIQIEPSDPAIQQAILRLIETVKKALNSKMRHKHLDVLRAQFEMRNDIDELAKGNLQTYFGNFYRLLGIKKSDGGETWLDSEDDGSKDDHGHVDGIKFCKTLMIVLSEEGQETVPVKVSTNPDSISTMNADMRIQTNAQRVAEGNPPLSEIEFEKEYYGYDREQEAKEAWLEEQWAEHQYEEMERHHREQMQILEEEEFAERLDEEAGITVEAPPMNEEGKKKMADRLQAHKEKMDAMSDAEKREFDAKAKALKAEIEGRFQAYKAKMEAKQAGEAS
jgi:hypothetical protein